ncbi:MAG: hypothetical protein ACFCU8_16090 [Thermosynechococcaceae cyanobacterium]
MRLFLLTTLIVSLIPSNAFAQDWKSWSKQNPTYPSPAKPAAPAPAAPQKPAAATPTKSGSQGLEIRSTQDPLFQKIFMAKCTAKGAQYTNYCACTLQGVQNRYSIQEVERLSIQMKETGQIPDSFRDVIVSCIDYAQ